jgi:hypothetical protein
MPLGTFHVLLFRSRLHPLIALGILEGVGFELTRGGATIVKHKLESFTIEYVFTGYFNKRVIKISRFFALLDVKG